MPYTRTALMRDVALALHAWEPADPHTVVVYIHG